MTKAGPDLPIDIIASGCGIRGGPTETNLSRSESDYNLVLSIHRVFRYLIYLT